MNRISDMFDMYEDDSTKIQDIDTTSNDKIKELTMSKINKKAKRPITKMVLIAAVVAVLSVSALAYSLSASGELQRLFGKGEGEALSPEQLDVLDKAGIALHDSVTSNGTTITPVASIADEYNYYMLVDIEAPEDVVFPALTEDEGFYQFDLDVENIGSYGATYYWYTDLYPSSNKMRAAILIHSSDNPDSDFLLNDGHSRIMRLENIYIQSPDKVYTTFLEGVWEFDIGDDFDGQTVEFPVKGLEVLSESAYETTGDEYILTMESLSVSNISISLSYKWKSDNDMISPGLDTIEVVMKDGSVVIPASYEELLEGEVAEPVDDRDEESIEYYNNLWLEAYREAKTGNFTVRGQDFVIALLSPIDPLEIAYVQLGDQQVFLD